MFGVVDVPASESSIMRLLTFLPFLYLISFSYLLPSALAGDATAAWAALPQWALVIKRYLLFQFPLSSFVTPKFSFVKP